MFTSTIALLTLAASASATVFITTPTAGTTCSGGQPCNIRWQEGGSAPTLKDFGPAQVFLGVGNAQQQTMLQTIADNVDVSTTQAIVFTPSPAVGANSPDYFIRVQSIAAKDPANAQFPALSFSAKFTLNAMTGTFNATVQSQIDGLSTAPLGGGPTSAAGSATGTPAKTTGSSAASTKASGTSASASNTAAANANGAVGVSVPGAGLVGLVLASIAFIF